MPIEFIISSRFTGLCISALLFSPLIRIFFNWLESEEE